MDVEEDILLAKWLNHTISPEELTSLEQRIDLVALRNLLNRQEQLELEVKDTESLWKEFQEKTKTESSKNRRRPFFLVLLILILVIGSFFIFKALTNQSIEIKTVPKETKKLELADGTQIQISPNTSLLQYQANWSEERKIDLVGQAFFKVSKGVPFSVKTTAGLVEVLGTSFDIWSAENYMTVQCFEGQVRVTSTKTGQSVELKAGQQALLNNHVLGTVENFEEISPSWIEQNQHIYKRIPVRFVIRDIERFTGFSVEAKGLNLDDLFSGLIVFKTVEEAARYLGESMGWNYVVTTDAIQFSN